MALRVCPSRLCQSSIRIYNFCIKITVHTCLILSKGLAKEVLTLVECKASTVQEQLYSQQGAGQLPGKLSDDLSYPHI